MIISHKYKFIFLKTGKTAGTSMEIALSRFCGETDIITPISPEDEKIRRSLGYRGPQNYVIPFSGYAFKDFILMPFKKKQFYKHISAREIIQLIGGEIWNDYYTFCFERNPWDRVLSLYYWHYKSEPRPAISQFINSKSPQALKRRGYNMYTIDDKVAVDKIYLYEQLQHEVERISGLFGFPEKLDLPRAKTSYRSDKKFRSFLPSKSLPPHGTCFPISPTFFIRPTSKGDFVFRVCLMAVEASTSLEPGKRDSYLKKSFTGRRSISRPMAPGSLP